jgi:ADP-heptose:LPS heptosyltransferase
MLRNVLIFHAGALGDFIMTWPLAMALGRLYPQSRVIYVTAASKGKLAERAIGVESVDADTGWHPLYMPAAQLPARSAALLAAGHTIITFVADAAGVWKANVAAAAPQARIVELLPHPGAGLSIHFSEFLLGELSAQPVLQQALGQMLASIGQRGLGRAMTIDLAQPILLHPGSGATDKCWPVGHFMELAARLRASSRAVRFVLGEVEAERFDSATVRELNSIGPVVRPPTYLDLLGELRSAAGWIGNDSGPSHLAGIAGLPTLALFGPTDPQTWRPLGPQVRTLRAEPLANLSVDRVYNAWIELTAAGRSGVVPSRASAVDEADDD